MCGIAGIIASREVDPTALRRMSDSLSHRGPDGHATMWYVPGSGIRVDQADAAASAPGGATAAFAHRRLAILDLSEANSQPMADESGQYCLAFNGEIYNYLELRAELEREGYTFKTNGDTEVLLRAYQAWGPACLARLNGMWAFALLDVPERRVILSRDRFGIKPLYLALRGGTVYFASEIKGLLAAPNLGCEPNERTVARFLLTGLVDHTNDTFFTGIQALPAAHWLAISLDRPDTAVTPVRYWDFPAETFTGSEDEAIQHFRDLFLDAVRLHLQSDVPIGTCLSGGLDSSSIVCAAAWLCQKGEMPHYAHYAFGYRSPDPASNEAPHMERVVSATAAKMHYVDFEGCLFEDTLPQILRAQDEPFGSASIVAQWFVFQRARAEGMKVMLDGQGADETLAGYHGYFAAIVARQLAQGRLAAFLRLRSDYQREIGTFPVPLRSAAHLLLARWLPHLETLLRHNRPPLHAWPLSVALRETLNRPEWLVRDDAGKTNAPSLGTQLQDDVRSLVLPALLRYEDRNSMAHSLEARVPFLDYRLVEFAASLPDEWKIRGTTTKYILRQAMRGVLPEAIRARKDKIGFKADPALTVSYFKARRGEFMANKTEWERRWFRPEEVDGLLAQYDGSVTAEFALWRILNTKLWVRQFWG